MDQSLGELNESEMATIEGGMDDFGCTLLGVGAVAGLLGGSLWFTAGCILSAYNGGCFC